MLHEKRDLMMSTFGIDKNRDRLKNMNRFIKTWMLWLLMLALPVQAQVTAIQTTCGIGHERLSGDKMANAGHRTLAKASIRHKYKAVTSRSIHRAKVLKAAPAVAGHDEEHLTCNFGIVCGSASVALPYISSDTFISTGSIRHLTNLPASLASFIPEGLERPPRQHHS
jgi:hypothetical protein